LPGTAIDRVTILERTIQMSANQTKVPESQGGATAAEGTAGENVKVRSDVLVAKVKDLLHEGTVRRIIVKDEHGHTILEIPVTAGVVVAVVAPVLTAVAALAALASNWEIEIDRSSEDASRR
jgi:Domain of unknown function (DUF4342)